MNYHTMSRMHYLSDHDRLDTESLPGEWFALWERVRAMPLDIRAELEPLVEEALEESRCRGRVQNLARDALARLQLDLAIAHFDLDATRREREELRRLLEATGTEGRN